MTDFDNALTEVEVIRGLDFEKYLAIEAVSNSRLKLLDKSPLHYEANPSTESTRSMGLGTLVHTALLEPSEYTRRYVCPPPGMRMDKRTKAYKEFLEHAPAGVEVVKGSDYHLATTIADDVRNDPALARFFGPDCESELTVIWTDEATVLRCKCRIDKFCPGIGALDVKTTQDCTLNRFPWDAKKYGYFQQAAFYTRGIKAAQKAGKLPETQPHDPFYFLAVETGPVRAHALYVTPGAEQFHFDSVVSARLDAIAECKAKDSWPGPNGESGEPLLLTYPGALGYEDDDIIAMEE